MSRNKERLIWIIIVIVLAFILLINVMDNKTKIERKIGDIRGTYEFRVNDEVMDEAIDNGVVDSTKLPENPYIYFLIEPKTERYLIYNQDSEVLEEGNFKISDTVENVVHLFPQDRDNSFIEINPVDMSFSYVLNEYKDDVRHFVKTSNALTYIGDFTKEQMIDVE